MTEKEAKLIDANALIEWCRPHGHTGEPISFETLKEYIEAQPTIDAVPVVHGRWVVERHRSHGKFSHCSECGLVKKSADTPYLNFCSKCGAKMDLKDEN